MASELVVEGRAPTELEPAPRGPTEWGASEYVRMVAGDVPRYDGAYEVTPTIGPQTLETQDRLMMDDVTIEGIPIYEVSNESGTTVYIATLED